MTQRTNRIIMRVRSNHRVQSNLRLHFLHTMADMNNSVFLLLLFFFFCIFRSPNQRAATTKEKNTDFKSTPYQSTRQRGVEIIKKAPSLNANGVQ